MWALLSETHHYDDSRITTGIACFFITIMLDPGQTP